MRHVHPLPPPQGMIPGWMRINPTGRDGAAEPGLGEGVSDRVHSVRGPLHRHGRLLLLLVLALMIVAGGCRRHLTPPEPSYKPLRRMGKIMRPPPASLKKSSPKQASLKKPGSKKPETVKPADRHTAKTPPAPANTPPAKTNPAVTNPAVTNPIVARIEPLTKAPAPPPPRLPKPQPRVEVADPFDESRPCYSRDQMARAESVLFNGGRVLDPQRWLLAINGALHRLEAPCSDDDLLVLVLTTIQLESGVAADPALENRDLEKLFQLRLKKIKAEVPLAESLLESSTLDDVIQAKLRRDTRRGHIRTEGELVSYVRKDLRPWLVGHLQEEYYLPEAVARFIAEKGVPNPIRTLGPMQVNIFKAAANAKLRGEVLGGASAGESVEAMRERLLAKDTAIERGILEGVAQLWPAYAYYKARLPAEQAVRFATADYNAGEFSSRNAGFQERVALLTGHNLTLDGDLLLYRNGRPAKRVSQTESAVITLLRNVPAYRIRKDLLNEKAQNLDGTRTWREVCALFKGRKKQPCAIARVPGGASNEAAQMKMGRIYTPRNYSRAYLKRWRLNRTAYDGG